MVIDYPFLQKGLRISIPIMAPIAGKCSGCLNGFSAPTPIMDQLQLPFMDLGRGSCDS
jgi:hypothetical protein